MGRPAYILLPLLFSAWLASGQVKPLPGAELNYNQIMLEHPVIRGSSAYIMQVIYDSTGSSFNRPLLVLQDSFNASVVSGLSFGKSYLWRYRSISNNAASEWMGPYSFSILPDPYLIHQKLRLHIVQNDSSCSSGGLIIVDGFHCIFDRSGDLVWFLPPTKMPFGGLPETEDLNVTRAGTITALGNENGFEVDLTGRLIWKTPFKTKSKPLIPFGDFYNHDLKRLPNNHYMVIGRDNRWKKLPDEYNITKIPYLGDSTNWHPIQFDDGTSATEMARGYYLRKDSGGYDLLLNMGDIVEYDKNDTVVWRWSANDYLKTEDIFPKNEHLNPGIKDQDPHLNGFSVDAKNEYVYASFRKLDRIVKIEKKTGKVIYSWGAKMSSGEAKDGANFFHKQHAPVIANNGNIVLFNNADMTNHVEPSGVVEFSQPSTDNPSKNSMEVRL